MTFLSGETVFVKRKVLVSQKFVSYAWDYTVFKM